MAERAELLIVLAATAMLKVVVFSPATGTCMCGWSKRSPTAWRVIAPASNEQAAQRTAFIAGSSSFPSNVDPKFNLFHRLDQNRGKLESPLNDLLIVVNYDPGDSSPPRRPWA